MANMQPYSHYLVLDFEASGHNRDSKTWEIVEFPCAIVDARTGQIPEGGVFHTYVRPTANPSLSSFCTEQCGITQDVVDRAPAIEEVLPMFTRWVDEQARLLPMPAFALLTCGDYDLKTALPAEVANKRLPAPPSWLRRWVNLKKVFATSYLAPGARPLGMAGMLNVLRLALEGRHHSGIDDVRNLVRVVQRLLRDGVTMHVTGACGDAAVDPAPPVIPGVQGPPALAGLSEPAPRRTAKKAKTRLQGM